ncbi:MAG: hypothetical protein [Bacteriophage sp.]|nr:MAG: hypothetical protein [Bacteriophage sp.]
MKPKKFQEANVVYGEGQPEYKPLPAHKTKEGQAIFCFELDEAERKKIAETGELWVSLLTFNQPLQPIFITINKSDLFIQPDATQQTDNESSRLLSKKFFPAHFRAGEATDFKAKVLNGQKRHTCRCNYEYWKKKITALQEKSGTLCLRQWADKPYRSPQESILEVPANMCIVQPLILRRNGLNFTAEVEGHPVKLEDLARNDGLTPSEFAAWFIPVFDKAQETALTFAIIQFTTFRY